jgi:hypothetical protein
MNIMYKIWSDHQEECHLRESHVDETSHGKFCAHVGIEGAILCNLKLKSPLNSRNFLHINVIYEVLV